jgi:protein-disulfide isomerase
MNGWHIDGRVDDGHGRTRYADCLLKCAGRPTAMISAEATRRGRKIAATTAVLVFAILVVSAHSARAQNADERLSALSESIRELGRKVDELDRLLRSMLPPSPVEDVTPVRLSIAESPFLGSMTASLVVVEFSDFQCPFCGQHFRATLPQLRRQLVDTGQIQYVFKNFPLLDIHPQAHGAAVAGLCAHRQSAFWKMHDTLFEHQDQLSAEALDAHAQSLGLDKNRFQECSKDPAVRRVVERDMEEAKALGMTGTPTFLVGRIETPGTVTVLKRVTGAHPLTVLAAAVESVRTTPK